MEFKMKKRSLRKNELCTSPGKKNVDPFDELLSSPSKQEVNFKPLSFWDAESKKKKGSNWGMCKINYDLYDSDDVDSPCKNTLSRSGRVSNATTNNFWSDTSDEESTISESPLLFKSNDTIIKVLRQVNINQPYHSQKRNVSTLAKRISGMDDLSSETSCNHMTDFENIKSDTLSPSARAPNVTTNNFWADTSHEESTVSESPLLYKLNDTVIKVLRQVNVNQPYPSQERKVSTLTKKISGLTIVNDTLKDDPSTETSCNYTTDFENIKSVPDIFRNVTRRRRYDFDKWEEPKTITTESLEESCFAPNKSCAALSHSSMMFDMSFMNRTVKVVETEKSSAFKSALGLDTENLVSEDAYIKRSMAKKSSVIKPRDFILQECNQEEVLPFEQYFNERTLSNCKKIGEGVYGEVFMFGADSVIKIIPIEGADEVNGEPQKTFEEIIPEVVIASKLSSLRYGKKCKTSGFAEIKRTWCVVGKYPKYLLRLWDEFDRAGRGSENDSPSMFKSDQLYIILELAHGGKDLESYVFSTSAQSLSVFVQCAFSLAAAEKEFQFEHRDLHWGNLLIAPTKEKFMVVVLNNVEYKIPTKGVKVSIIDFTLSRISHEGCSIFNDLSADPGLFGSQGDYQFEIYRMMRKAVKDDWSLFVPQTNIYWLHYTLDKMVKMVRYKNSRAHVHKKGIKFFKSLEPVIMEHEDCFDFVLKEDLMSILR